MALKQVVLPAPFGPIRPRISPSLMSKETWSRAVRPPNRRVASSTSSIGRLATCPVGEVVGEVVSDIAGTFQLAFLQRFDLDLGLLDPPGPSGRQQTLRPPDRQGRQ